MGQISQVGYTCSTKLSIQAIVGKREVLQRGSVEEFIRESPTESVVTSPEYSELRAVT